MKVTNLAAATITKIAAAGNRDFLTVQNNSGATVYLCFDSDEATAGTGGTNPLTAANGFMVGDQGVYTISNDGNRNIYNKPIFAFSTGGGEIRLQGE